MENYLNSTYFIDSDHPDIIEYSEKNCDSNASNLDKAISLYYAVRDEIRYNPYTIEPDKASMKASTVLKRGEGWCVAKAIVLTACLRYQAIPARLGFADVKNHLNTRKLKELMGTDLFVYHGYTDVYLEGQWVKATPAFNLELCLNFNVKPLEFDGLRDSIFHPFDKAGNQHMEYVNDHGTFEDLPWDRIIAASLKQYPLYFERLGHTRGNFSAEALEEHE